MIVLIIIIAVLAVLCILYLLAVNPMHGRREQLKPFSDTFIAHRGLFNDTDIPENSIPAFIHAKEKGYGIELDVQMTSDGRLVVFHDETLKRMCGVDRKLYECTYSELQQYALKGTDQRIPLFDDALEAIGTDTPIIIEIKSEGNWQETTAKTAERLDSFNGIYCIESFHPLVLRWFKRNRPNALRGQLSSDFMHGSSASSAIGNFILTNLLTNFLSKPDFISYNHLFAGQFTFRLVRFIYRPVTAAWTVKSEDALSEALPVFQIIIFDSFIPSGH